MADLDHFKSNDRYGHVAGDIVLETAPPAPRRCVSDSIGRYGGEEFVIVARAAR